MVQGIIPISLPFFSYYIYQEKLSISRIISIILGVIGIFIIFMPNLNFKASKNLNLVLGLIAIIFGTLLYYFASVYCRRIFKNNSAISIAGWQNFIGGLALFILSFFTEIISENSIEIKNMLLFLKFYFLRLG